VPFSLLGILLTIYIRKILDSPRPNAELVTGALSVGPGADQAPPKA